MFKPFHLYLVFNPMINENSMYPSQAHEFYQQLKTKALELDTSKSFMYWGKIKVDNSVDDNFELYKQVISTNKSHGEHTHLYITDYHHFWVAKVESVHETIFMEEHTLSFYDNKDVSMWFKITDMDLLSSDFEETSCYLKQLFIDNDFNESKIESLSPYTGNLKFPVILQDHSSEKYFKNIHSEDILRVLQKNPLITNPKSSGSLRDSMQSFVLPPEVFAKLSSLSKKELLEVELLLSQSNKSESNLFNKVMNSYIRILESTLNDTLGNLIRFEYSEELYVDQHGTCLSQNKFEGSVLLKNYDGLLALNAFKQFAGLHNDFDQGHPKLEAFIQSKLIQFIDKNELISLRESFQKERDINISKEHALMVRNSILGVGCKGIINSLYHILFSEELENHTSALVA
jgi:hypothetical protein